MALKIPVPRRKIEFLNIFNFNMGFYNKSHNSLSLMTYKYIVRHIAEWSGRLKPAGHYAAQKEWGNMRINEDEEKKKNNEKKSKKKTKKKKRNNNIKNNNNSGNSGFAVSIYRISRNTLKEIRIPEQIYKRNMKKFEFEYLNSRKWINE